LWTALWALFFSTLLLGVEYLAQSDLLTQFHTFGRFQAQEMLAGRFPLWSPGSYGGFPFAADTQAAVFYLPRWLTIFLSAPWDFPYYALELEGLLHIWLLGIFTYFLAHDITRNRWAGLIAAVAFGLGGFITSYPLLQLAILETVTWIPLILLLLRRGVGAKRPLPYLIGASLILGLSFLAGHPQTFLHISYLAAFYYLFLTIRARWQWQWVLGLGALIAITAVGVSAAAWLPALRYMQASTRSDVGYEFVAKGFALLDYFQLFVPGPMTVWVPMYVGLPVLALGVLAWLLHHTASSETKTELYFWTGAAIVTLIISLGDKGIFYELVYRVVPGFSLFRQQERIASLFSLSMALSAALGLSLWQQANETAQKQAVRRLLWIMLGGLLFTGFILAAIKKSDWVTLWLQQIGTTAVTLILLWRTKPTNWRGLGLVLLLSFDLFLLSRQQLNYATGSPAIYWPQPTWLTTLRNEDPDRIETQGFYTANVGELHNLEDIRGISPLRPQYMAQFEQLAAETRWQLLNVSHIFAGEAFVDGMTPLVSIDQSIFPNQSLPTTIFHYEKALPRARMVYHPVIVSNKDDILLALQAPEFDPSTQVVLTNQVGDVTGITPPNAPPSITTTHRAANEHHIQATTDTPGILVISEWAYPGWQATVNGSPWPIETANYAQQALILPAGSHNITLRFAPWDVNVGVLISLLTLLGAGILAWRWQPTITFRTSSNQSSQRKLDLSHIKLQKAARAEPVEVWVSSNSSLVSQQKWLWAMILVLLLAFGLRIFLLGNQELRGDEAFSYLFARMPAAEITPTLIAEGDPHSPFHYLMLHGWMKLSGDSEFAMRFIALLPGLLIVPLAYQMGQILGSRRLGVLVAFWLAISHLLIWLSQDVRNQYMLTLFFSMLATVILTWKLVNHSSANATGWWRLFFWLAYVVAAALAVYSHYYGLFILAAHGLYVWGGRNGRFHRLASWILAGTATALLFLPWAITVTRSLLAAGQLSDPSKPELAQYLAEVGIALTAGLHIGGWWTRWLFVSVLAVVILGAVWLLKKKPNWGLLLVGWLASATLIIYLIRFSRATFNSFYISIAAPAWWLLFSVGLVVLWQQRWRGWRIVASVVVLMVVVANSIGLKNYYFDPAYSRSNGYRLAAEQIEAQAQPGDIFLAQFPDPVWGYYLRNTGLPTTMQPTAPGVPQADTEQALHTLTETYDRIWFAPHESSVWDTENVVGRWLDYHLFHESQSQHQKLPLWTLRPARTAVTSATVINNLLNEEITLHAAHATVNGVPTNPNEPLSVSSGDALSVTLIWSALDTIPENYTVFVHLQADDGSLVAQHDGAPLFGTRPTTTWQPNEQLIDRHELVIAETGFVGNGRLFIGMYHPETLERLSFENGETALELIPVVINK